VSLQTTARKLGGDGADVTWIERYSFQMFEQATGKARSPTVDNGVRRTISEDDDAERRRHRGPKTGGTR